MIAKFEENPKKKGTCPQCERKGVFRYYVGLEQTFGKCERKNSCGYHNKPKSKDLTELKIPKSEPEILSVYPDENELKNIIDKYDSVFHKICKEKLDIPIEHFKKWNIGSNGNLTAFIFRNRNNKFYNIKFVEYDEKGKRNKAQTPYSLKPKSKNEKYPLCLFGEHLISDKPICIVESEKTAFLADFIYPQFNWLATSSSTGLTDEKISVLFNKEVFYFPDADKAGRENSSIKNLSKHKINFKIIDLFPEREDGYDLADSIFDGLKIDISSKINSSKSVTVKQVKGTKESLFERTEKIINDEFDLRYNEVANELEYKPKGVETDFKIMNENNLYRFLQHNNLRISQANLSALLRSDFVPVYNPFLDYFKGLKKWEPETEPDYINEIGSYVIAKDPERFKTHLKKHLVRCIACALRDNFFNKHAFVLVLDVQNSGKTSFIRWLCPPVLSNYMTETFNTDKDGQITLSENFIINLDELATMNKSDINSLKSYFSRNSVKVRRPYAKNVSVAPRRANFFGSTDRNEFLNDEAGSVRWLCFQLEKIIWDYSKKIDVNNLWRQAYTLYLSGFKFDLTADEIRENENVNKMFRITTPELELIAKTFDSGTKEQYDVFYTATEVLNDLIQKYPNFKLNHVSIGKAMKTLGFAQEQKRKSENDYPVKGYYLNNK